MYLLISLPSIFVFFSQDTFFAHFAKYLPRPTGTCEFTRNLRGSDGSTSDGPNGMEKNASLVGDFLDTYKEDYFGFACLMLGTLEKV